MSKEFNDIGTCIPEKHFMADINAKLVPIIALIEKGKYFTINRPRQYGKTTTQYMLWRRLQENTEYTAINISFESISSENYRTEELFMKGLFREFKTYARDTRHQELLELVEKYQKEANLYGLDDFITDLTAGKKVVLMIDEVDKNSNNQLFLDFLALLRDKYLKREQGRGSTFQSVILAGVHDVKNLRLKISQDKELRYNSPWNIAADFKVDLSLTPDEIAGMLQEFSTERGVTMDISRIAARLFHHTSGYPFLTSRLCKMIDEEMDVGLEWRNDHVDRAAALILKENTTNFQSLIKNLIDNEALYMLTQSILLDGTVLSVGDNTPGVVEGIMYGIFQSNGKITVHNRIYEQYVYNYMSDKLRVDLLIDGAFNNYTFRDNYLNDDGALNFERILLKFQEFMKVEHSNRDKKFYEREGRLFFWPFCGPSSTVTVSTSKSPRFPRKNGWILSWCIGNRSSSLS